MISELRLRVVAIGDPAKNAATQFQELENFLESHELALCSLEVPIFLEKDLEGYIRALVRCLSRVSPRSITFVLRNAAIALSSSVELVRDVLCPAVSAQDVLTNITLDLRLALPPETFQVCCMLLYAAKTCTSVMVRSANSAHVSAILSFMMDRALAHLGTPSIRQITRIDISEVFLSFGSRVFPLDKLLCGLYVAQLGDFRQGLPPDRTHGIVCDYIMNVGTTSVLDLVDFTESRKPRALALTLKRAIRWEAEEVRDLGQCLARNGTEEISIRLSSTFHGDWLEAFVQGLSESRCLRTVSFENFDRKLCLLEACLVVLLQMPQLRVLRVCPCSGGVSDTLTELLKEHAGLEVVLFENNEPVTPEAVLPTLASNYNRRSQSLCLLLLQFFQTVVADDLGRVDIHLVRPSCASHKRKSPVLVC